jgi:hypothetical protein
MLSFQYPPALRSLKQELDFHGLEREDNPPTYCAVEHSGVQWRSDVTAIC